MKIALVHDYLYTYGGAERVLSSLHKMYPDAPIYTSLVDKKRMGKQWREFEDANIIESWFGKLPFASYLISPLRFLLPAIWGSFDFSDYDLVITSAAWAVTKGMKRSKKQYEICYLHTPPRWLYGYDESVNWKNKWYGWVVKSYALIVGHFLRQYDFEHAQPPSRDASSSQGVDLFVVNSQNIGKRVEKFYRRTDYKVIYPPIDIEKFLNAKIKPHGGNYFLTGGRMTYAKNFDLIINACKKAKVNLKIYGTGTEEMRLNKLKNNHIEFLGRVSDEELVSYYKGAKGFILAQKDEDFGITAVEAAAAGIPTLAFRGGGYLESVVEAKTGMFFDDLSTDSLALAIKKFEKVKFKKEDCINHAKKFSEEIFQKEMKKIINTV